MTGDDLIRATELTKVYGSDENAIRALDGVDLVVEPGEFLAIMGPSGCGKSTLLNMIGALDQPTSGEVWVAGENLARLRSVDEFRARTVGFIFQLHNLLPTLTARENVEVPMQGQGVGAPERKRRARSNCLPWSGWKNAATICRTSSRAVSGNAWRWRVRWRTTRC